MRYRMKEGTMFTKLVRVVGVTHKNEDGRKRQALLCRLYDDWYTEGMLEDIVIELRREPDNPVDPNAVGVWCAEPEECEGRLGFVPRDDAEVVGEAIDDGTLRRVELDEPKGMGTSSGGGVWMKLRLRIVDGDDSPDDGDEAEEFEDEDGNVWDLLD